MKQKKQCKRSHLRKPACWLSSVLVMAMVLGMIPNMPMTVEAGSTGSAEVIETPMTIDTGVMSSANDDNAQTGVWTPFTDTGEIYGHWSTWETEEQNASGYNYAKIEETGGKEDAGVLHFKRADTYKHIGIAINAGMTIGQSYTIKANVKSLAAAPYGGLDFYANGDVKVATIGDGQTVPNDGAWHEVSASFTANKSGIYLFLNGGNYTSDVYVDNIKVLDAEGNDMLNGAGNFCTKEVQNIVEIPAGINTSVMSSANADNAQTGVWTPFTDTGEIYGNWSTWETEEQNASGYNYAKVEETGGKEDAGVLHFRRADTYKHIGIAIDAGMTIGQSYTIKANVKSLAAAPYGGLVFYGNGDIKVATIGDGQTVPNDGAWHEVSASFTANKSGIYLFLDGGNYTSDVYVDNIKVLDAEGNDMLNSAGNFCTKEVRPTVKKVASIDTGVISSANADNAQTGVWTRFTDTGEIYGNWSTWETEEQSASGYNYAKIEETGGKEDAGVLHFKRADTYKHIGIAINAGMTIGQSYTIKANVKSLAAAPYGGLVFYGNGDIKVATIGDGQTVPNDGAWHEVSASFTANKSGIYLFLDGGNYTSDVYVDNIKVLDAEENDMLNGAGNFYTEMLAQEYEYCSDISTYRGGTKTAPTKAGYLFAGWYQDAACKNPLSVDTTSGSAYAKFIDEDMAKVYAQLPKDTTVESDKTNIRFISTVDVLDYQEVGFKIKIGTGSESMKKLTEVYSQLYAVRDSQELDTLVPSELCSPISRYFVAYSFWNVPKASYGEEIHVTPYYVTFDGTTVYGAETIKTVNMGLGI